MFYQAKRVPDSNLKSSLQKQYLPEQKKILFLGDSITHGRVSYDYVQSLAGRFDPNQYSLINEGINSRLSQQIWELTDAVVKLSPDLIFIMIGTNDAKASLNKEEYDRYRSLWNLKEPANLESYTNHLDAICKKLKEETKARIVLVSIPLLGEDSASIPYKVASQYALAVKSIALKHNVGYIPFFETLEIKWEEKFSKEKKGRAYETNVWPMYWTILKYYSTTYDWNQLSDANGYFFLTDGIHLNERSGQILEAFIYKEIHKKD
ncbi:hypothetical protein LPTSP4_22940 [Leptospira ryugenii]|uniref:SGNH hydrolase-type esterase domain-containing protein n=1 Tax=Leptospira ryugenii TaxID=1917863 RepID=A0A2P2E1K0_9LEPT|nr:hypothetical protein LPTSP4_22940 [Leptospira ryugenii]